MITEKIKKDMYEALLARNIIKRDFLSCVVAALNAKAKDAKHELDLSEEIDIIRKEIKALQSTIEKIQSNATDTNDQHSNYIADCQKKIDLLTSYIPPQMSEDEIRLEIAKEVAATEPPITMAKLMPTVGKRLKSNADSTVIARICKEFLS